MASTGQESEQVQEARNAGNSQGVPAQAPGAEGGPGRAVLPLESQPELGSLTVSGGFTRLSGNSSGSQAGFGLSGFGASATFNDSGLVEDLRGTLVVEPSVTFRSGWAAVVSKEEPDTGAKVAWEHNLFDRGNTGGLA